MYIHTKTLFTSKVKHDHIIFRISRLIRISTLNMSCSRHSYKTRDHTSFFSPLNYILNTDPDIQNLKKNNFHHNTRMFKFKTNFLDG